RPVALARKARDPYNAFLCKPIRVSRRSSIRARCRAHHRAMAKSSSVKKSPPRSAPHQVRIIGGQWKRTPLAVLEAEGLRPTPDRVRETVFNWINHLIDGGWGSLRCLDAFAGTGVLGFEAASRGAAEVVMVETQTQAVRQIETIKDKLRAEQVRIQRSDAISTMQPLERNGPP